MINIMGTTIIVLAVVVHIQVLFLLAEVFASLAIENAADGRRESRHPSLCVIIPAHNESELIAKTVGAIRSQLTVGDRLVVIADNCSDDTANVASLAGAEVVERRDPEHVGKGYALDRGIRFLQQSGPPEVIIFVDADCELAPGSVEALAQESAAHQRPVQATNLIEDPRLSGRTARIRHFAWKVKNYVRPLGASRLGLPCQLTGTGMALPWSPACSADLSSGHIAEDTKLGVDLTIAGYEPRFCPRATVTSRFAASTEGIRIQRTRWEHGHLTMIYEYVPVLLWNAFATRRVAPLAMALDLSIPPLGLFLLIMITLTGGSVLVTLGGFSTWSIIVTGSTLPMFGLAIALAWYRHGCTIVSARDLLFAPVYALSKIPMFWRFLTRRQTVWIRSERDRDPVDP